MRKLTTIEDIEALSEHEKDIVFAFDTARERCRSGIIKGYLIPFTMIVLSQLMPSILMETQELQTIYDASVDYARWFLLFSGGLGFVLFSYAPIKECQEGRFFEGKLRDMQIDASFLSSVIVWDGMIGSKSRIAHFLDVDEVDVRYFRGVVVVFLLAVAGMFFPDPGGFILRLCATGGVVWVIVSYLRHRLSSGE
jgi:hypothetical protein